MLSLLDGCVPLPYPPMSTNQITQETVDSIKPGASMRADVLLTLSDPDMRGDKDTYFIYNWEQGHGGVVFIIGGGTGVAPVAKVVSNTCISLAIKFTPDGKVVAMKQFSGEPKGTETMMLGKYDSLPLSGCSNSTMSRDIDAWLNVPTP